ncbi:MAG: hypothetical protein F4087_06490 [Gemmatimonadetes bacterium]|nr:hypothetical protein [Gemmatimonadota bacterium]MYE71357.1 hypothetical protein [Gemmatimonadota bacterium]MYJ68144.1 hypothetical protein [Gemmatimonadota bacterium]
MRSSRLPAVKTLADFDFSFQPTVKREQIDSLHELGFVERRENVVFLGPPGVGKTQLVHQPGGHRGRERAQVYYGTLTDLIDSLNEAQAAGRLNQRLKTLTHPALLVVDEIGYLPVSRSGAILFFQLVNRRYEHASTVLTSNQGFSAGARSCTTRSWPRPCWTVPSTAAPSSKSAATATGCDVTPNSPRRSTQRPPRALTAERSDEEGPRDGGSAETPTPPSSGRSALAARAPKCQIFDGQNCQIFGGH